MLLHLKMEGLVILGSGFKKISGAGYSTTDLETFLSFPFSPLSICFSSPSIDQSDFS